MVRQRIGFVCLLMVAGCASQPEYDVIIRNGMIYDGSGSPPYRGDLAIADDTIVAMGAIVPGSAPLEIEADGLAVAPGFINLLSSATVS